MKIQFNALLMFLLFVGISCSTEDGNPAVDQEISTRAGGSDCELELGDPTIADCDIFESIVIDGSSIDFNFASSALVSLQGGCLEQTSIYNPNQTTTYTSNTCGVREVYVHYDTEVQDETLTVQVLPSPVPCNSDNPMPFELCFVTECVSLHEGLQQCFARHESSQGANTFCIKLFVTCEP